MEGIKPEKIKRDTPAVVLSKNIARCRMYVIIINVKNVLQGEYHMPGIEYINLFDEVQKRGYQDILRRLDKLEQEEVIGAFDKRTIIELSGDVIKEIAQKYENVQKGIGGMMSGALLETEARTILNRGKAEGRNETKKETALRMLQDGELPINKIAKYSGLDIAEVELLAGLQTM